MAVSGCTAMHKIFIYQKTHSRYFLDLYKLAFSKTFDIFCYIYIFHSYRKLVWYTVLQSTENKSIDI